MKMRTKTLFKPACAALLAFVLIAWLAPAALAQEWGEVREATANLNVRNKPNKDGEHVVTLTKGQRVRTAFPKNGWIAVFDLDQTERDLSKAIGYANAKFLKVVKVAKPAPVEPEQKAAVEPVQKAVVEPEKAKAAAPTVPAEAPPAKPLKASGGELKAPVEATPPVDPLRVGVDPTRIPVKITSDRMTYDESGKVVSFVGNVVAQHGELTLWADTLSAFLASKDNKKFSADSVDRIVAEGNVRAKKGTSEGSCGKLTYFVGPQLLKMEQDPLLKDGPNSLTGEVINFHVGDNRSEVLGSDQQRVKAIFLAPEKLKVK